MQSNGVSHLQEFHDPRSFSLSLSRCLSWWCSSRRSSAHYEFRWIRCEWIMKRSINLVIVLSAVLRSNRRRLRFGYDILRTKIAEINKLTSKQEICSIDSMQTATQACNLNDRRFSAALSLPLLAHSSIFHMEVTHCASHNSISCFICHLLFDARRSIAQICSVRVLHVISSARFLISLRLSPAASLSPSNLPLRLPRMGSSVLSFLCEL